MQHPCPRCKTLLNLPPTQASHIRVTCPTCAHGFEIKIKRKQPSPTNRKPSRGGRKLIQAELVEDSPQGSPASPTSSPGLVEPVVVSPAPVQPKTQPVVVSPAPAQPVEQVVEQVVATQLGPPDSPRQYVAPGSDSVIGLNPPLGTPVSQPIGPPGGYYPVQRKKKKPANLLPLWIGLGSIAGLLAIVAVGWVVVTQLGGLSADMAGGDVGDVIDFTPPRYFSPVEGRDFGHPRLNELLQVVDDHVHSFSDLPPTAQALIDHRKSATKLAHDYERFLVEVAQEEPISISLAPSAKSQFRMFGPKMDALNQKKFDQMSDADIERINSTEDVLTEEQDKHFTLVSKAIESYFMSALFELRAPYTPAQKLNHEVVDHCRSYLKALAGIDSKADSSLASVEIDSLTQKMEAAALDRLRFTEGHTIDSRQPDCDNFQEASAATTHVFVARLIREGYLSDRLEMSLRRFETALEAYSLASLGHNAVQLRQMFRSPKELDFPI